MWETADRSTAAAPRCSEPHPPPVRTEEKNALVRELSGGR
jgi:hypothetical protein